MYGPLTWAVPAIVLTIGAGLIYVIIDYVRILLLRKKLPPGPFPLPLFGNKFQIPSERQWKKLAEWSQHYNDPIITFWEGHKPILVCNDAWSMSDLCDKRANIYSSRPFQTLTGKCFGFYDDNQAGMPYGEKWRLHRRVTHAATNAQVVQKYRPFQANEVKLLIRDCLEKPDRYVDWIERFTVSIVSIVAWGRRIDTTNDTVAKVAAAFVGSSKLGLPGFTYTETIPILADLPSWMNPLPKALRNLALMSNKYFFALSEEGSRSSEDNFAKRLLKEKEEHGISKVDIANLTGNFIGAGVDTTSSTVITFILAMCLYPEVQKRAQAEIDDVIGANRCPDWSDEENLPFVAAIINETLRWRPAFALGGPPHCPIQDDIYREYFIPKGTTIMGNSYAISRNAREYPEPEIFKPERFLSGNERPSYPNRRGIITFGWGRRVCSGEPMALQSLFISIVSFLWAFNIQPGLDDEGKEVKLDPDAYGTGQVMRPLPFKVRFTPRNENVLELIKQEAAKAREELRRYDGETKITLENAQEVSLDSPVIAYEKV